MSLLGKFFGQDTVLAQAKMKVKNNPNDAVAWATLGDVYFHSKHHKDAIPCYLKSLELDGSRADVAFRLGGSLIIADEYDAAIMVLKDLAEKIPVPTHLYALTQAYFLAKKPQETVFAARKAIELKPQDAQLWIWLGKAQEDLGKIAQALEAYHKAAELDQKNGDLWAEIATCHLEIWQFQEALTSLERAAKLDSKYRKELDTMKRDWKRFIIAPFEESSPPPAEIWLRFFVEYILANHDIEPAVKAFMANLEFFHTKFGIELEEIESAIPSQKWQGISSFMFNQVYVCTAANLLHVYRNYISKGKNRQEIRVAFEESAHKILDGHEAVLHHQK